MVNEGFCEPCQRMLAEHDVPTKREHARTHHQDGESFRKAIDMGCHICCQSWVEFERPDILGPTRCYMWINDEPDPLGLDCLVIIHNTPQLGLQSDTPEWDSFLRYAERKAEFYFQPWPIEHARMGASDRATNHSDAWLSDNTGSDRSFEFLLSKYEDCVSNHKDCSRLESGRSLPTRLLDVGKEEIGQVHLVDQDSVLPGATYSTLSHCWGDSVPLKLTKSTETTLYNGIAVGQLPKTFQHAVAVARKLDIRYLWIDSLCIYQDSIDDWSLEAAAMHDVYRNAMLNIAATAAVGSHVGLFNHRNPTEVEPFKVDVAWRLLTARFGAAALPFESCLCFQFCDPHELIDSAPLNLRAWVMQERLLSRRIVHYTSTLLFWECCESFASEIHQENLPLGAVDLDWSPRYLKLLLKSSDEVGENENHRASGYRAYDKELLYEAWKTLKLFYSRCHLSHQEDKLVALAGIARKLSDMLQDELVAGLWKSQLLEELCWSVYTQNVPRPDVWVAPSWSWASCNAAIMSHPVLYPNLLDMAEVVHVDAHTEQSGALKNGVLTLRCRPVAALLRMRPPRVIFKSNGVHLQHLKKYRHGFYMDNSSYAQGHQDVLLVALVRDSGLSSSQEVIRGLLLVSSAKDSTVFERIGMFAEVYGIAYTFDYLASQIMTRYKDAEEQVITII